MSLGFKNDFGYSGVAPSSNKAQSENSIIDHFFELIGSLISNNVENVDFKVIPALLFDPVLPVGYLF